MIDLGRPSLHGEGVTIFGDHAQSNGSTAWPIVRVCERPPTAFRS